MLKAVMPYAVILNTVMLNVVAPSNVQLSLPDDLQRVRLHLHDEVRDVHGVHDDDDDNDDDHDDDHDDHDDNNAVDIKETTRPAKVPGVNVIKLFTAGFYESSQ